MSSRVKYRVFLKSPVMFRELSPWVETKMFLNMNMHLRKYLLAYHFKCRYFRYFIKVKISILYYNSKLKNILTNKIHFILDVFNDGKISPGNI